MSWQLIIRPEAETDIDDIYRWYEQRRKGLGRAFMIELDRLLSSIQQGPKMFPRAHKELRRALLKKFPYAVFYTLRADEIVISAVFHQSRDPLRWMSLA